MMHAGTPPAESGSGGPKVLMTQFPAPLHWLESVHERLGSAEQNDPRLPKKSQIGSTVPSQPEISPVMVEPVCTRELWAMPVHPVSRSAPGTTENVTVPRAGHVQFAEHCPGQS